MDATTLHPLMHLNTHFKPCQKGAAELRVLGRLWNCECILIHCAMLCKFLIVCFQSSFNAEVKEVEEFKVPEGEGVKLDTLPHVQESVSFYTFSAAPDKIMI